MLFNSPIYIFLFLPIVLLGYFALSRYRLTQAAKSWLVAASLLFYGYWNPAYLPLILASMLVNYGLGSVLGREQKQQRRTINNKAILSAGIVLNLAFLGYFKYADFFLENLNMILGTETHLLHLLLPLAISFFTFQQIAYLVDSFQHQTKEYDFLNYCLFVTFFPQLIAGPIVHHKEMMPQFARLRNNVINYRNLARGLFLFFIGLFKKVIIADTFAVWATQGFDQFQILNLGDAWATSLAYAMQLYFDFSGYTDMAIGSALMFNINLPLNFNSPYKGQNIQDFWRRWHMTLSRWLRDYLYVPLGGNRKGEARTLVNLFITFLLGGLWHGAGWTFIIWGALHGAATAFFKLWQDWGVRLPKWVGWFITFNFVNLAWVFFRATNYSDAIKVLSGMAGLSGVALPTLLPDNALWLSLFFLGVTVLAPNSLQLVERFRPTRGWAALLVVVVIVSLFNLSRVSEFLYFQF